MTVKQCVCGGKGAHDISHLGPSSSTKVIVFDIEVLFIIFNFGWKVLSLRSVYMSLYSSKFPVNFLLLLVYANIIIANKDGFISTCGFDIHHLKKLIYHNCYHHVMQYSEREKAFIFSSQVYVCGWCIMSALTAFAWQFLIFLASMFCGLLKTKNAKCSYRKIEDEIMKYHPE
jgi:hypothetical protein